MFRHLRFALVGLVFLVLLPTTAVAAAPSGPVYPGVTSSSAAQLQALAANLPAPTAAQLATAQAWLAKHPLKDGTVTIQYASSMTGALGVTPDVNIGVQWNGIYMHFTQADIHNIWDLIWAAGIGAAAAVLCSPGVWLAVACAIGGAVVAYIVAEVIWYYIGYYVPSCGVHIIYYWTGGFGWGNC